MSNRSRVPNRIVVEIIAGLFIIASALISSQMKPEASSQNLKDAYEYFKKKATIEVEK